MQNIQEEFRICSSLCIVIILIIHVVNSLKMYILEQKYQNMCTNLRFRCSIFQIFIEKWRIFFQNFDRKTIESLRFCEIFEMCNIS